MVLKYAACLLGLVIIGSACSTTKDGKKKSGVRVQIADVYINDEFRGTTPGTIRISRSRQELDIALKQGKTTVRAFSVEETYGQNTAEVVFSVSGSRPDGSLTYTVEELPSRDKLNYIIPYFEERLTIEDNQYGLTIIVLD